MKRGTQLVSYHWGVDSSKSVTRELYNSILSTYGKPEFWGRSLTGVEGVTEGVTKEELELLHSNGIKLLPIYSDFRRAIGESHAKVVAMNATYQAKRLGLKKGTMIFVHLAKALPIDSAWIKGFVDYMYNTDYKPGFYVDPTEGDFSNSYCEAASQSDRVAKQAVLWSAAPDEGVSTVTEAPEFNPAGPPCEANVWAWQYGHDTGNLKINTNLIDNRVLQMLS